MSELLDWGRRRSGVVLLAAIALLTLIYLASYYGFEARPNPASKYPLGWWGWFDQGEYLKSIRGFATGAVQSSDFLYPPLYALLSAPFWLISQTHPTLVPDLIYCLVFHGSLLVVARRFYGSWLPLLVCAALLVGAPILTITQWVIPWTSSLQAALAGGMILIFSTAEARPEPFGLSSRRDWALFAAFFLAYGALAPTRPLDMVVWLPFAVVFFVRTTWASVGSAPPARKGGTALLCLVVAAGCGACMVAGYLGFNLAIHGSLLGAYGAVAGANGYFPADVPEKIFSVFWDSGVVYGEAGQGLFQRFPLFAPVFAVSIVTAVVVSDVRRWIVLTALLNFLVYLPYGDMLPTGFFRYFNLHYFKWTYPWLAVIAAGQVWFWMGERGGRRTNWGLLAASGAIVLVGLGVGLRPTARQAVLDRRSPTAHTVQVTAPRRREVDFVDIKGLGGSFTDFYFGSYAVVLDGVTQPASTFRVLPLSDGGRLMFLRPTSFSQLDIRLSPAISFAPDVNRSGLGSVRIGASCLIRNCEGPPEMAWASPEAADGATRFNFRPGGNMHDVTLPGWWEGEPWGRWSQSARTRLDLAVKPGGEFRVSTTAGPLIGGKRRTGWLRLSVNGCKIAEGRFTSASRQVIAGDVPSRCLRPDGLMRIEWRADGAARSVDVGAGQDTRRVGVAVEELIIQRR